MAGHSHAKTIKHRKNGQDVKRSKIFTKIQREIFIAAKSAGGEDKFNPKLRLAKQKARLFNMPNEKINDAIKRALSAGSSSSNFEECYYLIALSGGLFILVKVLTDNKNRSASDIRGISSKNSGTISESSAIDFLFENTGFIKYEASKYNFEEIFEKAIELGARDVITSEIIEENEDEEITHEAIEVLCEFKDFTNIKTTLEETFGEAKMAGTEFRPKAEIQLPSEKVDAVLKIIDELEELDDVSSTYTNFKKP